LNQLMKRYKDNEEAKDKFMSDRRVDAAKSSKKAVFGADGAPVTGEASEAGNGGEGWGSMFDGHADLAMARKQAAVTITRETDEAPKDTVEGSN
jgi:hypothetical protein